MMERVAVLTISCVAAFNVITPRGEEYRMFGSLLHQLRHLTGAWSGSIRDQQTVLLTDSYIDALPERVVLPCACVCDVCGFATPLDEADDGRISPQLFRAYKLEEAQKRRHLERHSFRPVWTTSNHLFSAGYKRN